MFDLIKCFLILQSKLITTMKKKDKRGGKRIGSGRKQTDDKKQQVTVYVAGSKIAMIGGVIHARKVAISAIDEKILQNNLRSVSLVKSESAKNNSK